MTRIPLLAALLLSACVSGRERSFTGSTPADPVVREFLGISAADSVDFIRWNLELEEKRFSLSCNYGRGKPNTNGFYGGGKWVRLAGILGENDREVYLEHGNHRLSFAKLNTNLLHVLNASKEMLTGTGGWSYTLNREGEQQREPLDHYSAASFADSVVFQGRTPCLPGSRGCYKQKWLLVLQENPASYFLKGTIVGSDERLLGVRGTWSAQRNRKGQLIFRLNDVAGKTVHFLMPATNIILLADEDGNPLVGNEDFSFTLNRRG
ncbi:MAG TPA: hypothetical protein VEB63_05900 [Chitinophagaceae bacterium]|nr:hypothetical protein [Chitinophagaceae bacterium]